MSFTPDTYRSRIMQPPAGTTSHVPREQTAILETLALVTLISADVRPVIPTFSERLPVHV